MPNEGTRRVVVAFTPEFKRNIRRLSRKYRHIRSDIAPVISQIEQGKTPGDQVKRTGYAIFKVRVKNTDAQRGKSGGYRMIYYLETQHRVILITIYSKTEQGDITPTEIRRIVQNFEDERR